MSAWIIVLGLVLAIDLLIIFAALKTSSDEDDKYGV